MVRFQIGSTYKTMSTYSSEHLFFVKQAVCVLKSRIRENVLLIKPGIQVHIEFKTKHFFIPKKLWKIKESAQIGFSGRLDFKLLAYREKLDKLFRLFWKI